MHSWQMFWTLWLLLAGASFAAITVVVAIKGVGDVRRMLTGIKSHEPAGQTATAPVKARPAPQK